MHLKAKAIDLFKIFVSNANYYFCLNPFRLFKYFNNFNFLI